MSPKGSTKQVPTRDKLLPGLSSHEVSFRFDSINPGCEVLGEEFAFGKESIMLPLKPGMRVALVCPCGRPNAPRVVQGMAVLTDWGLLPQAGPVCKAYLEGRGPLGDLDYLAASDEERLSELRWALTSPDVDACWVVRGGYGLGRVISSLCLDESERPVFGFSDATVLLHALVQRGWTSVVHAANVQSLSTLSPAALKATKNLVLGGQFPNLRGQWLRQGEAVGALWGGNLCVLASLCGSRVVVGSRPGILFLEDINEAPYRLDRMLNQLSEAGAFEDLQGVALGSFSECGNLSQLLSHWVPRWNVPVLAELPVGHTCDNFPLWLGQEVRMAQSQISRVSKSI